MKPVCDQTKVAEHCFHIVLGIYAVQGHLSLTSMSIDETSVCEQYFHVVLFTMLYKLDGSIAFSDSMLDSGLRVPG